MIDPYELILDECISALQAGVPLEEILAEVPEFAHELRPMLYAATVLSNPNPVLLPTAQKTALRNKYLQQVAILPPLPMPTWSDKLHAAYHIMRRRLTRQAIFSDLATISMTAILTLLMSLAMLNYAANGALPGDLLYNFKRVSEQIQLSLTLTESQAVALQTQFNVRRLAELEQLIQLNRLAVVEFTGVLESQVDNVWIVEGYTLILPADIHIEGQPQEGSRIHVVAFLRVNKTLVADMIQVVQ